jgi:hypothetical protein
MALAVGSIAARQVAGKEGGVKEDFSPAAEGANPKMRVAGGCNTLSLPAFH